MDHCLLILDDLTRFLFSPLIIILSLSHHDSMAIRVGGGHVLLLQRQRRQSGECCCCCNNGFCNNNSSSNIFVVRLVTTAGGLSIYLVQFINTHTQGSIIRWSKAAAAAAVVAAAATWQLHCPCNNNNNSSSSRPWEMAETCQLSFGAKYGEEEERESICFPAAQTIDDTERELLLGTDLPILPIYLCHWCCCCSNV